jgi:hypothetical protein
LDELDCLDLLADFVDVIIPSAVWTEVEHHRPAALANRKISLRRIVVDFAPSGQMIQSVDDLR